MIMYVYINGQDILNKECEYYKNYRFTSILKVESWRKQSCFFFLRQDLGDYEL